MAELLIHTDKIKENIKSLSSFFAERNVYWSLITKVFSGDKEFLTHLLTDEVIEDIQSIGDSRLTSLKNLKEVNPDIRTIYIKPPAATYADEVVKYADISLNSSMETILALNEEAIKQDKIHHIIIMIDLGELREGINRTDIMDFYEQVFELSNISVLGIGSNLGCMYGITPTYDKLLQLALYKELIAEKFNRSVYMISGGSSITLPLLRDGVTPPEINHFRIGEAAFFGTEPLSGKQFLNLNTDTFEFCAHIIELEKKKMIPEGEISDASIGNIADLDEINRNETTYKAILDFGLLDVNHEDLVLKDESDDIKFVGMTSDMTVLDIGDNLNADGTSRYQVGDVIHFTPNYMAVARLLNSKFIDRKFTS
ncbi:MAG: alanine racemase [Weeksellaceae bacterium]